MEKDITGEVIIPQEELDRQAEIELAAKNPEEVDE